MRSGACFIEGGLSYLSLSCKNPLGHSKSIFYIVNKLQYWCSYPHRWKGVLSNDSSPLKFPLCVSQQLSLSVKVANCQCGRNMSMPVAVDILIINNYDRSKKFLIKKNNKFTYSTSSAETGILRYDFLHRYSINFLKYIFKPFNHMYTLQVKLKPNQRGLPQWLLPTLACKRLGVQVPSPSPSPGLEP